jgi:polar amino acid transport system substrate-binding protein
MAAVVGLAVLSACGAAPSGSASGVFEPDQVGVLTVATNLPSPGFWEGTAAAPTGGFEYELAIELAERFGLDTVRVVDVEFEQLVAGDLGGADLALAELTPTTERRAVLDFSTAYLESHPGVLVRSGTEVSDLADARELRWAAQAGSIHADFVEGAIQPTGGLAEFSDIGLVVDALERGDVDAALLDLPAAVVQERLTGGALVAVAQFANDDVLAAGLPRGSGNVEAVDAAIRAMHRDGTIERLATQWLGSASGNGVFDIPLIRSRGVRT